MLDDNNENKELLEYNFLKYLGMTLDQFEKLDFEVQNQLIKKVMKLEEKQKNKKQKIHIKNVIDDIFNYYPIFEKVTKKRKSLLKK